MAYIVAAGQLTMKVCYTSCELLVYLCILDLQVNHLRVYIYN